MNKPYNFFSGPSILPEIVLQQAAEAIHNFAGTGLSILEVSHRSKQFVAAMEEARTLVKQLLKLDDNKEVLFLQGGASMQFCMVPYNLLGADETAAYLDTGHWAHEAIKEAARFGNTKVLGSSAESNYNYIPKEWLLDFDDTNVAYTHITTNNTIYGNQWSSALLIDFIAKAKGVLVADMSSDIFSRNVDYNRFDLIYAGAQKNMGPAGTTLVVISKDLLQKKVRNVPAMLDYSVHVAKDSMHNTPSVFAVYVSLLTLRWIAAKGLNTIEKDNDEKAAYLYHAVDASSIFEGTVKHEDRSKMNVCFGLKDKTKEAAFLKFAEDNNLLGLAGHRTVGGFRASIYNAMTIEGVQQLVKVMQEFESKNL